MHAFVSPINSCSITLLRLHPNSQPQTQHPSTQVRTQGLPTPHAQNQTKAAASPHQPLQSIMVEPSPLLPPPPPPPPSSSSAQHIPSQNRPLSPSNPHHRRSSSRASNNNTAARPSSASSTSFLVVDGERAPSKRQRAETWERVSMKLQAGVWVVGTMAMLHYTDFVHVLLNDERIYRGYFHVAMMCVGINLCIGAYLIVYLPFIKGVDLEWAIYCPRMIPAATATGVVCAFTLVSSLWPVYGFFAPLILLVLFMGGIFSLHFIPWPF